MDVENVLNHYNIYFEMVPNTPDELYYICPFHDDTEVGSARFNVDKGLFNCFACNTSGNIYQFVAKMENCDVKQAEQLLVTNWTPTNKYNLDTLKSVLNRKQNIHNQTTSRSKLPTKLIEAILNNIVKHKPDIQFVSEWIVVGTYILNKEFFNRKSESQMLDLYTQFHQQLKKGVLE